MRWRRSSVGGVFGRKWHASILLIALNVHCAACISNVEQQRVISDKARALHKLCHATEPNYAGFAGKSSFRYFRHACNKPGTERSCGLQGHGQSQYLTATSTV